MKIRWLKFIKTTSPDEFWNDLMTVANNWSITTHRRLSNSWNSGILGENLRRRRARFVYQPKLLTGYRPLIQHCSNLMTLPGYYNWSNPAKWAFLSSKTSSVNYNFCPARYFSSTESSPREINRGGGGMSNKMEPLFHQFRNHNYTGCTG